MAHGRPRDPHKEQQWRQRIQLWQDSGLSIPDFCRRHRLAPALFYSWRRRLNQRQTETIPFVPVELLSQPSPGTNPCLEVVLANGRSLRVPADFDGPTLRRLLTLLEEDSPC